MSLGNLPRTLEIAPDGTLVRIVDQTKLPYQCVYDEIRTWQEMVDAIKRLEIRGAPALGVAGAAAVMLHVTNQCSKFDGKHGEGTGTLGQAPSPSPLPSDAPLQAFPVKAFLDELDRVAHRIATARPTAVNLSWGVKRTVEAINDALAGVQGCESGQRVTASTPMPKPHEAPEDFLRSAQKAALDEARCIAQEDEASCRRIGSWGATLLPEGARVLTHCNAGSLATSYYGTALGVIYSAFSQGKIARVFADETRPVGQGARLTSWELAQVGVPVTLICDNMAASLMAQGKVDAVIVGADRICANGDAANKIGTYGLAVLAAHHHIPFYVAAPFSTVDFTLSEGSQIEIEQRNPEEVLARPIPGVDVYNPAFDVTPASLITAIITDEGIIKPSQLGTGHI